MGDYMGWGLEKIDFVSTVCRKTSRGKISKTPLNSPFLWFRQSPLREATCAVSPPAVARRILCAHQDSHEAVPVSRESATGERRDATLRFRIYTKFNPVNNASGKGEIPSDTSFAWRKAQPDAGSCILWNILKSFKGRMDASYKVQHLRLCTIFLARHFKLCTCGTLGCAL